MNRLVLLVTFATAHTVKRSGSVWNYDENGRDWGNDEPACNLNNQSPIDIPKNAIPTPIENDFIPLNYQVAASWEAVNNGHSVQFNIASGPSISGGGLSGSYILAQFHFHWGSDTEGGAEHLVDGERHFAEVHLVHYKEEYGSIGVAAGNPDGLAVLGFFLETADNVESGAMDDLITNTIGKKLQEQSSTFTVENMAIGDIIPDTLDNFYRYMGSLTTPACNEAVIWTVFKNPIGITQATRDIMAAFAQDDTSHTITKNYRFTQPLNNRTVTFYTTSAEKADDNNDPASDPQTEPEPEAESSTPRSIVCHTLFVTLILISSF